MTRAITADELTKLRLPGQSGKIGLAILQPATVFTCHSAIMSSNDQVATVGYNTGVGTLANVLPGMTCYVGTTDGGHELGMVRIRKAPDSSFIYIGETSDIDWSISRYLTVVDDFAIWPIHWRMVDTDPTHVKMDYDREYTDQHTTFDPVINIGSHRVLYKTYSTIFNPTGSFCPGSTMASYAWAGTGSPTIATVGANTTFTWTTGGTKRISCTGTAANGKTFTVYRYVFIFDDDNPPITGFEVSNSPSGSLDSGGWNYGVTLYNTAAQTAVRDKSLAILFTYGETNCMGDLAGSENILCVGWVSERTITADAGKGPAVRFTVQGPHYWLSQCYGFPAGVKYSDNATSWPYLTGLTTDLGVYHILRYRSTFTLTGDMYLAGSVLLLPATDTPGGSLWAQVESTAKAILANCACNRYGQFYMRVDPNMLMVSARSAVPVVMAITDDDFIPQVGISHKDITPGATLDVVGMAFDGSTTTPYQSRSPGYSPKQYGSAIPPEEGVLVANQTALNSIAGLMLGSKNNPFPSVDISLAANNRFIDITPPQYVTLTLTDEDTGGWVEWTDQKLIPRQVELEINGRTGAIKTSLTCEPETFMENGVAVPILQPGEYNFAMPPLSVGFSFLPDDFSFPNLVWSNEDGTYRGYRTPFTCARMTDPDWSTAIETYYNRSLSPAQDFSGLPTAEGFYQAGSWYLYPGQSSPVLSIATYGYTSSAGPYTGPLWLGVRPGTWNKPSWMEILFTAYNYNTGATTWGAPLGWQHHRDLYTMTVTISGGSLPAPVTYPVLLKTVDGYMGDYFYIDFAGVTEPFWFKYYQLNYIAGPTPGTDPNDPTTAHFITFGYKSYDMPIIEGCL